MILINSTASLLVCHKFFLASLDRPSRGAFSLAFPHCSCCWCIVMYFSAYRFGSRVSPSAQSNCGGAAVHQRFHEAKRLRKGEDAPEAMGMQVTKQLFTLGICFVPFLSFPPLPSSPLLSPLLPLFLCFFLRFIYYVCLYASRR